MVKNEPDWLLKYGITHINIIRIYKYFHRKIDSTSIIALITLENIFNRKEDTPIIITNKTKRL